MQRISPLQILIEQRAKLEKDAEDQRLFMKEIGHFLTSGDEQYVDRCRYNEILRQLELVRQEIAALVQTSSGHRHESRRFDLPSMN